MVVIRMARVTAYFKSEVGYEHPARDYEREHCGICVHYHAHRCDIVRGPIQPEDWCKKFKAK